LSKDKKIRWRLAAAALAVLTLLALSGAAYLLFSPLDLTRFGKRIEKAIEAKTGRKVLFDEIVVKALPEPDITVTGLRIYQGADLLMSAKKLRVRLAGLPLRRRVVIGNIEVSGPELFVKRDAAGGLNISGDLKKLPGGNGVIIRSLDLKDGLISITDYAADGPASYTVSGIRATISESKNGFVYGAKGTLQPDSAITLSGERSEDSGTTGTGSIKDLGLERLNPYLKKTGVKFLDGTAELDLSYILGKTRSIKSVVRYKALHASVATLAKPVRSERGTALVAFTERGDGLGKVDITGARLMVNGIMASGDLSIIGIGGIGSKGSSPYFTLNASSTEASFNAYKDLVPIKALKSRAADAVNAVTPLGGTITVRKVFAQGPLEAARKGLIFEKPVDISCDVGLDGLKFKYRGLSKTFSGITGSLGLKNGILTFKGAGAYDNMAMKGISWELKDIPREPSFTLRLGATGDAAEILDDIKEFTKGKPLGKVRASGHADVDFSLEGYVAGAKRYSINAAVKDGTFSYEGLPLTLKSLNGRVSFDNDRITFRGMRGTDGRTDALLDGYIRDWLKPAPYFDLAGSGKLSKETLAPFVKSADFDRLSVVGAIAFKGTVKGTKEKLSSALAVDTAGADIEYGNFIKKAQSTALSAEGSFELSGRDLAVKNLKIAFGQSSLDLDGSVYIGRRDFNLHARSKGVRIADIDDISPYLSAESRADGLVKFDMRAARYANESSYEGEIKITDGRFRTPLVARRVERVNASAQFSGNDAIITIDNMTVGGSQITGTINLPDLKGGVVIFDIFSPRLYVEDFIDLKESERAPMLPGAKLPAPAGPRSFKKPVIGMGRIVIRDGGAWGHAFHDFSSDVRISDDAIYLKPLTVAIDRGLVKGEVTYYADASEPHVFEADLRVTGLDLEKTIALLRPEEKYLSGSLNGRISVTAKRGVKPFASGLNGEMSLRSDDGKLWQFLFFTKIFSVVNVFSINELFRTGLPYKTISGDFNIKDGIISTDNLIFNSHSMRMSAVGKLSIPEKSIDSVIAVKPFVTIDYILSQIPLVGWIIQGKEKSTLSMYFEVTGPLKDTDVMPVTVTGVGKGILGILQRLIEAPIKIIKPDLE